MAGNCLSWLDDVERRFAVVTPLHLPMIVPDVLVCRQAAGLDSLSPRWEYYSPLRSTRPVSLSLFLSLSLSFSLSLSLSLSLTHTLFLYFSRSAVAFACKLPKSNLGNLNKELEKCSHWSNRYYDFLVHDVSYNPGIINSFSFDMSEYVFHFLYLFIFLVQRDGETRRRRILLSNLQLVIKIIIFHRVIACDVLCVPLKGTCELFARSAASYQTG